MKKSFILILLFFVGCGKQASRKSVSSLNTFEDSTSYSIGADLGTNLKRQNVEINYDVFLSGLVDGMEFEDAETKLNQNERRKIMSALQNKIREKEKNQGSENLKIADEFLAENKKKSDVKETPTGLQYRVLQEGDGAKPKLDDKVKVHYVGRLINGTKFDSSVDRGEPTEFGLNQVIKGWTEGLQLMNTGSKYEFFIHPKIAYGPRTRPQIPANSLLIFEVELLEVLSKK
jgi:FKBP-type peptidyl-prolyl cis-trans isomerase